MKAFLAWHDEPFRKTHNLIEVGEQCATLDPTLTELMQRAAVLMDYAWRFRYPGESEEPPLSEAREAFAVAREVYDAILRRVPREARP
jgi:hypothetical protein